MARRGKSFGTKFSFDLGALGFGGRLGLMQLTSAQAPPSAFPPLDAQPSKLIEDDDHEYLVELSRNFHSLVNDSPFYIKPVKSVVPSIERYSDIIEQDEEAKQPKSKKWPREDQWIIDWERFPMELRPISMRGKLIPDNDEIIDRNEKVVIAKKGSSKKRVSTTKSSEANKKKRKLFVKDEEEEIDEGTIQERLANLEKLEAQGSSLIREIKQESVEIDEDSGSGDEENEKNKKQKADEDENKASEDEDEAGNEEDFEEEMGDYGDDYFDNGEEYGDDDDGDNEGPTY